MANWWETAPLAEEGGDGTGTPQSKAEENWWESAPLVGEYIPAGEQSDEEQSLGISALKAIPKGGIETAALIPEAYAVQRRRSQGMVAGFDSRIRRAGELSEDEYRTTLREIASSDMPASLKMEMTNNLRDVRLGIVKPQEVPDFGSRFTGNLAESASKGLRGIADEIEIPQEHQDKLPVQVGHGIGSTGVFVGSRLLPGGQLLLPVAAGSIGAGEAVERAARAGASDEKQAEAALLGVAPGLTDMVPVERLLSPLARMPGVKGALKAITRKMVEQGIIEGTQEAIQNFLQAAVQDVTGTLEKTVQMHPWGTEDFEKMRSLGLDPSSMAHRKAYLTGGEMVEGGIVGFLVGALFGAGGGTVQTMLTDPNQPQADLEPGPGDRPEPPPAAPAATKYEGGIDYAPPGEPVAQPVTEQRKAGIESFEGPLTTSPGVGITSYEGGIDYERAGIELPEATFEGWPFEVVKDEAKDAELEEVSPGVYINKDDPLTNPFRRAEPRYDDEGSLVGWEPEKPQKYGIEGPAEATHRVKVEQPRQRSIEKRNIRMGDVTLPPNFKDPRLKREGYRETLKQMASELQKGVAGTPIWGERGETHYNPEAGDMPGGDFIAGRLKSPNPRWFTDNERWTVDDVHNAVNAALSGKRLGIGQARIVETMLDEQTFRSGEDPLQQRAIDYAKEELERARADRRAWRQGFPPISVYDDPDEDNAGEIFEESAYEIDWDGPMRAMHEIALEASEVDPDEAYNIIERDELAGVPETETVGKLLTLIAEAKRGEEAETTEPAEGLAEEEPESSGVRPEGESDAEATGATQEEVTPSEEDFLSPGDEVDPSTPSAKVSVPGMWRHDGDHLTAFTEDGRIRIERVEDADEPDTYRIVYEGPPEVDSEGTSSLRMAIRTVEESHNAAGVRKDEERVSSPGDDREGSEAQSGEDLEQPASGKPGDESKPQAGARDETGKGGKEPKPGLKKGDIRDAGGRGVIRDGEMLVPIDRIENLNDIDYYDKGKKLVSADIAEAYSADTLGNHQKRRIRKPFSFAGNLYTNTGGVGSKWKVHRLVPREQWTGDAPVEYQPGLSRERGGYEGLLVRHGKTEYVIAETLKTRWGLPVPKKSAASLEEAKRRWSDHTSKKLGMQPKEDYATGVVWKTLAGAQYAVPRNVDGTDGEYGYLYLKKNGVVYAIRVSASAYSPADGVKAETAEEKEPEQASMFDEKGKADDESRDVSERPDGQDSAEEIDEKANEAATSPENDRPEPSQAQKEAENYRVGDEIKLANGVRAKVENPRGSHRFKIDTDRLWTLINVMHRSDGDVLEKQGEAALEILERAESDLRIAFEELRGNAKVPAAFKRIEDARQTLADEFPGYAKTLGSILDGAWFNEMPDHYGRILGTVGRDKDHVDIFIGPDVGHAQKVYVIDQTNESGEFDEHKVMYGYGTMPKARAAYLATYPKGWTGLGNVTTFSLDEFATWVNDKVATKKPAADYQGAAEEEVSDEEGADARAQFLAEEREKAPENALSDLTEHLTGLKGNAEAAYNSTYGDFRDTQEEAVLSWLSKETKAANEDEDEIRKSGLDALAQDLKANKPEYFTDAYWRHVKDEAAKGYTPPKGKQEGVGPRLRRHWELFEKNKSKEAQELDEVIKDFEDATDRKKIFPIGSIAGPNATPGLHRYLELLRSKISPFKTVASKSHWYGDFRTYVKVESNRADAWKKAETYVKAITRLAEGLDGVNTIDEAATRLVLVLEEPGIDGATRLSDNFYHYTPRAISLTWHFSRTGRFTGQLKKDEDKKEVDITGKKKPMRRFKLDRIEREGFDSRIKGSAGANDLVERFGFAGVTYGDYVTADQRRKHTTHALNAFHDLAETLGIEPVQISLDGTLHIAFGALGHGRHSAHYQPHQPVPPMGAVAAINLTNTRGDGSVAHEWGHALDYHLRPGRSETMTDAVRAVVARLKYRVDPGMFEVIKGRVDLFLDGRMWYDGMKRGGPIGNARYELDRLASSLSRGNLGYLRDGITGFFNQARGMDKGGGKKYWSTDTELFARAFEAYVFDKMDGDAKRSDYLVSNWVADGQVSKNSGYRGAPFPRGEERERINEVMERFLSLVEWTENGPRVSADFNEKFHEDRRRLIAQITELRDNLEEYARERKLEEERAKVEAKRAREEEERRKEEELKSQLSELVESTDTGERTITDELSEMSDDDIDALLDDVTDQTASSNADQRHSESSEAAKPDPGPKVTRIKALADQIRTAHLRENKPFDWRRLFKMADEAFGGTQAEGTYTPKDAYEAIELALNDQIHQYQGDLDLSPEERAKHLRELTELVPTQTKRTGEQIAFQQFSTPSDLSFVAAHAANIDPTDVVLEPSAGTGNLAVWGLVAGAETHVNEIAQTRREILETQGYAAVYSEDAEYLEATVGKHVQPTVILMNPPFSSSGTRGVKDAEIQQKHIRQALRTLAPGGRLVAVAGKTLDFEHNQQVRKWWEGIEKEYNVLANIGIDGSQYRKFGTSFDVQLIVIDKTGPTKGSPLVSVRRQKEVSALPKLLEDIRNERSRPTKSAPDKSPRATGTQAGEGKDQSELPLFGPTDVVGGGAPAGRPGQRPSAGEGGTGVEQTPDRTPGGRDDLSGVSGRPGRNQRPAGGRGAATAGSGGAGATTGASSQAAGDQPNVSVTKLATSFASHGVKGSAEVLDGLAELFGGKGTLKSFPAGVDPDTYAKAKPRFEKALAEFQAAGKDLRELFSALIDAFGEGIKPYLKVFAQEVRDGKVRVDERDTGPKDGAKELTVQAVSESEDTTQPDKLSDDIYEGYRPRVSVAGAKPHPGELVESAAMGAVTAPPVDYSPNLPQDLIDSGGLSSAQLEPIILAGAAHNRMLPSSEGETTFRAGFLIGDGTGVGKGREISGIIMDNMRWGRDKAVWISKNNDLYNDAIRDWTAIGGRADMLNPLSKVKAGAQIKHDQGIVYATYDALGRSVKKKAKEQKDKGPGDYWKGDVVEIEDFRGKTRVKLTKPGSDGIGWNYVDEETGRDGYGLPENIVRVIKKSSKRSASTSRVDQLVDWLGEDFDGVIAFDEAHAMGNNMATRGARGTVGASGRAMAGVELQQRLPNARIVYVTATSATEVSHLGYMERLGLWGRGTPFANKRGFVNDIESAGVAAMEIVAQNLKASGHGLSRSLSYKDVTYGELLHELSDEQVAIYDELARAWQIAQQDIHTAMGEEVTGSGGDPRRKSATQSLFWGAHQRFFNQVITSMQMPSVLTSIEGDLENGHSAVLQLVNTNEAQQERSLAKLEAEGGNLDDFDMTPRDTLMDMIERVFPVEQYEKYIDSNGDEKWRPATDSQGNPILNPEAVRMRDELLAKLGSIRIPDGPLEMLMNHFGSGAVAEVTGRSRRIVRDPETGQAKEEKLTDRRREKETEEFLEGKRRILIFSDKGGTGRSYHADLEIKNQQKRIHYLIQPGWRADGAVQGFGRTHRSNQRQAPHYVLVTTNLKAQRRFLSSIARRLDQLGALTRGQRQTGGQGIFSTEYNLENQYAKDAMRTLFDDIVKRGRQSGSESESIEVEGLDPEITLEMLEEQMGLRDLVDEDGGLNDTKVPPITRFLNRLLSLDTKMMDKVFEAFWERLQNIIETARENGTFDAGIETLAADSVVATHREIVYTDERTGAETEYVKLELTEPTVRRTFDEIAELAAVGGLQFFAKKPRGRITAFFKARDYTDSRGNIVPRYRAYTVVGAPKFEKQSEVSVDGYYKTHEKIDDLAEARKLWNEDYEKAPTTRTYSRHLITGSILPVWDRLRGDPRVYRAQTDEGERLIGRVIPESHLKQTLTALGAEGERINVSPAEIVEQVLADASKTFVLSNGWRIKQRVVSGEPRIEITGPGFSERDQLKSDGVIEEVIQHQTRYFVPTGENGTEVMAKIVQYRPVVEILGGDEAMLASRPEPGTRGVGMPVADVEAAIAGTVLKWGDNAPSIVVVQSVSDLPEDVRADALTDEEGIYDAKNGVVYLIASNLHTTERARVVLAHESIGHHSMEQIVEDWPRIVNRMMWLKKAGNRVANSLFEEARERGYDPTNEDVFAREMLAIAVERDVKAPAIRRLIDRIRAAIRAFLKRIGLVSDFTDADINALVVSATRNLKRAPRPAPRDTTGTRYSQPQPWYYSQMQRALAEKLPGKGTPAAYKKAIQTHARKGLFKKEELEWSGVIEWLDARIEALNENKTLFEDYARFLPKGFEAADVPDDYITGKTPDEILNHFFVDLAITAKKNIKKLSTLTKGEVLDFLAANQIEVTETMLGGREFNVTAEEADEYLFQHFAPETTISSAYDDPETGDTQVVYHLYPHFDQAKDTVAYLKNLAAKPGVTAWQISDAIYGDLGGLVIEEHKEADGTAYYVKEGLHESRWDSLDEARRRLVTLQKEIAGGDEISDSRGTVYRGYTLPGGEDYREFLLTLPMSQGPYSVVDLPDGDYGVVNAAGALEPGTYADHHDASVAADDLNASVKGEPRGEQFRSPHFGEPNILAHVRFNTRTDADGKRVLFVEEVQSDWHQQGRETGYRKPGMEWEVFDVQTGRTLKQFKTKKEAGQYINANPRKNLDFDKVAGPPDAPFKTTWPLLVIKRMIRYASEHGFDRIAWTTGQQQNERYDLTRHVDHVNYSVMSDGRYDVMLLDKNGSMIGDHAQRWTYDEVVKHVGRDVAEKMKRVEGVAPSPEAFPSVLQIQGLDIEVGGEGMKGFYDRMLPSMVNKYVKKWGAKVGRADIVVNKLVPDDLTAKQREELDRLQTRDPESLSRIEHVRLNDLVQQQDDSRRTEKRHSNVHSLDITPEMRQSALQGQPLFSQPKSISPLSQVAESLARDDTSFQYPKSHATDFATIVEEMSAGQPGEFRVKDQGGALLIYRKIPEDTTVHDRLMIAVAKPENGTSYAIIQPGRRAIGGSLAYQMAMTWAHNNGIKLVPDPNGITAMNRLRRTEAMISSMLRFRTSRHLEPHPEQYAGLLPMEAFADQATGFERKGFRPDYTQQLFKLRRSLWQDESKARTVEGARQIYENNLDNLLVASAALTLRRMPELQQYHREPDGDLFRFNDGTWEPVRGLPEPGTFQLAEGVGRTTGERAVVLASALRGDKSAGLDTLLQFPTERLSSEGGGALVRGPWARFASLAQNRADQPEYVNRLFYSRPPHRRPPQGQHPETIYGLLASGQQAGMAFPSGRAGEWEVAIFRNASGELFARGPRRRQMRNRAEAEEALKRQGLTVSFEPPVSVQLKQQPLIDGHYDIAKADLEDLLAAHWLKRLRNPKKVTQAYWYRGRIGYQDFYLPLLYQQREIAKSVGQSRLPDDVDAYLAEELYHSRAGSRVEAFEREVVEPLMNKMADNDVAIEDLELYLHARHAPEANAKLKEINPNRENNWVLSGMASTEAEREALPPDHRVRDLPSAESVMSEVEQAGKKKLFDELAGMVDKISSDRLDMMVEYGLESEKTVKGWRDTYDYYAPLYREREDGGLMMPRGQGFSIRGREAHQRTGSTLPVGHILSHVVSNYEGTIIRGEKNRVSQTLLKLAQKHPNSRLWEIDKVRYRAVVDPKTGLVVQKRDPTYDSAHHVVDVKVNGDVHRIVFNEHNPTAVRIAHAMKNLGSNQIHPIMEAMHFLMRYYSWVNTGGNPEFMFTNFARDLQTAGVNLQSIEEAEGVRVDAMKSIPKAIRGIRDAMRSDGNSEWAKHYREFELEGGKTGWLEMYEKIEGRRDSLVALMRKHKVGKKDPRELFRSAMRLVSDYNTVIENGVRLSVYVHLVRRGVSKKRAASAAKNLTVNFNRKGEWGRHANTLYLFFNAAMQGAHIMFRAATSARVRKFIAAAIMLGFTQDLINRFLAPDDDDGENTYDQIPSHIRERNWIFMHPEFMGGEGGYEKFPMPYGYNVFPLLGQKFARALPVVGAKHWDPVEESLDFALAVFNSWSPIGGESTIGQLISPTIFDPVVQWGENKDWAGRPLRKEQIPYGPNKPEHTMHFNSTSQTARWVSKALNEWSGGDPIKPGAIDINPALFDLAWDTLTGGAGRFYADTLNVPLQLIDDPSELSTYRVPIWRRFHGTPPRSQTFRQFYDTLDRIEMARDRVEYYNDLAKQADDPAKPEARRIADAIRAEHAKELRLRDEAQRRRQRVSLLRKRIDVIDQKDDWSRTRRNEQKKKYRDEIDRLMKEFLKKWNEEEVDDAA